MEDDLRHFLRHWFSGLESGLNRLDEPARLTVLQECGKACARSYTAQVFRDTWQASRNLHDFLEGLSLRFPEARYERQGPDHILVTYSRCACDLVQLGLVKSPILCACSAANLQANFSQALGCPVQATLRASLLRGDPACVFIVGIPELAGNSVPDI